MVLIDPARNPQPYYDISRQRNARIVAVFETHPHADFVSSHLEIHETTGAAVYVSRLLGAAYEHTGVSEGEQVRIGGISFTVLETPGHSPDSICLVAVDENGKEKAVFTGDTLFIGDCGRPDLREGVGAVTATRDLLARQMYHSLREKLMSLPDNLEVLPAHGAGSLCGRGLSTSHSSTIGAEKATNWSLQPMSEDEFVKELLTNQPFVPKYFGYDVELNRKGAPAFAASIEKVKKAGALPASFEDHLIIDTREKSAFQDGHLKNAVNLMNGEKFETWLGSIVAPGEDFYLLAADKESLQVLIERVAKIGYEGQILLACAVRNIAGKNEEPLDVEKFRKDTDRFTIVDIRNPSEVAEAPVFPSAVAIPLYELRERGARIPQDKPIVVHCAGGYRSAAGASILRNILKPETMIYDLGEAVRTF